MTPEERKAHLKAYRAAYHQRMRVENKERLKEYYETQKAKGHTRYWIAKEDREAK
jgi:hypothetical protein